MIKQLSIFVENEMGKLSLITDMLSKNNIDIKALSLADTAEYGVLRLIVDDHQRAKDMLRQAGITVKTSRVIAVAMEDKIGELARLLAILTENDLGIEYMYAFMAKEENKAYSIIRAEDNDKAVEVFNANGIQMMENSDFSII